MVSKALKILSFLSVVAAFLLLSKVSPASASAGDNIRGIAYTGTKGYIVFNCLDDNFGARFPFTFPFTFKVPPCTYAYGVNLDANNNFSGNAWNESAGFVTFNASSTPSDDFRALCNNGNTCTNANSCTACYNETDGKVYGYMRVVGGEWIRLDNTVVNPTTQITNYNAPQPGIFSGYATSTTFGAISFNCSNDDSCATNDYRVKIGQLEIRQQTAPNWGSNEACSQRANQAVLKWNIRSGVQSAYQVIVSKENSTSTGVIANVTASTSATRVSLSSLEYDTPYYWFLRLWDDTGSSTPWRQFNISGTKDWITDNYTRNTQIGNSKTFTSYKHEFPLPAFTWTPNQIIIATTTNSFVSNSYYYNDSSNTPHECTGSICTLLWTTSDSRAEISSSTFPMTSIMFTKATSTIVTLTSTDDTYYTCSTSTILNVNYDLPLWKEINP